jgi:anti-sigma factor RsiW
MSHPDPLRVQAYFDHELDTAAATQMQQHLQQCTQCGALLQDLEQMRTGLRQTLTEQRTPAALRVRIDQLLDHEADSSHLSESAAEPRAHLRAPVRASRGWWARASWANGSFWLGNLSGGAIVAAAAAVWAFVIWIPHLQPFGDDLVAAHVRALISTHPIDVVSTDRHTVKPWFAGHADVSPVVGDFDAQGYRLIGGRADYLRHQRAAVMVYQHGAHTIDVFSWAAGPGTLPSDMTRDGYHLACWRTQDLDYCAVSDTGRDELHALAHLLQDLSAREDP